jgi:cytochrome P450
MTITEATFRLATQAESSRAKGSFLLNTLKAPFYYGNMVWTTINTVRNAHNTLLWDSPLVQKVYDTFMNRIGLKPEYPYIRERFSLLGTNYNLYDPELIKKFYEIHRNGADGLFAPNKSMTIMGQMLMKWFPGLTLEDFIGTCADDQTRLLHGLLQRKLNRGSINEKFHVIQEKCQEILIDIARADSPVNFNEAARLYNAEVFGQTLFDDPEVGLKIGKLIVEFKSYLIRVFMKRMTKDDAQFAERMAAEVQECTKKLLEEVTDLPLFAGSNLTLAQKQAMIFITLFAAQDNTTTLLSAMVGHLAKVSDDEIAELEKAAVQHLLKEDRTPFNYPQEITEYLNAILKLYPPVPLVARGVKNDLCIDFKIEGDNQTHTKFIPKGAFVAARMIDIGDRFFGERGPHTCPGKDLAKVETLEFFTQLLAHYNFSHHGSTDYHLESQVTSNLTPDVMIRLHEPESEIDDILLLAQNENLG